MVRHGAGKWPLVRTRLLIYATRHNKIVSPLTDEEPISKI